MLALLSGFALGFLGSVPAAGPLAITVVSSALESNRARALRVAVGGAAAECAWAALVLVGNDALRLERWMGSTLVRGVAIVVLLALGLSMLRARPLASALVGPSLARRASELSLGFFLVASNPSFALAWAGSAVLLASLPAPYREPVAAVVLGAFLGVVAWYVLLTSLLARAGRRLEPRLTMTVSRVLGAAVIVFALFLAAKLVAA